MSDLSDMANDLSKLLDLREEEEMIKRSLPAFAPLASIKDRLDRLDVIAQERAEIAKRRTGPMWKVING